MPPYPPSLRFMTANQQRIIIDNQGFVGFGPLGFDPTHPIHMASGAHVTVAGTWQSVSSREAKQDIEPLTVKRPSMPWPA